MYGKIFLRADRMSVCEKSSSACCRKSSSMIRDLRHRLLGSHVVAHCKVQTTLGTTAGKYFAAILAGHSFAEAVLVHTAAVGGLKSSFHFGISIYYYSITGSRGTAAFRTAKLLNDFQTAKYSVKKVLA